MNEYEKLAQAIIAHQRRMDIARRLARHWMRRPVTGTARPASVTNISTHPRFNPEAPHGN